MKVLSVVGAKGFHMSIVYKHLFVFMFLLITTRSWKIKNDKIKDVKVALFTDFILDGNKLEGNGCV